MNKASNPVMKDGLGILARLVVIVMLLSILSALLQGCTEGISENSMLNGETIEVQVQLLSVGVEKAYLPENWA